MPDKVQFYRDLAEQTAQQLTWDIAAWTGFLKTASRLYKYPYHEQLLIYAQRPDATACAGYDLWNNTMRRYVKRGSHGIALLDTTRDRPQIKYVFDISDTGGGEHSRRLNYGSIGMNTTRLCRKCFLTDMGSKTDAGSRSRSIPWSRRWLHNFGRTTWATFLTSLTDRICPITMRMKSGSLSAAPPPSVPPTQFWNAAACTRRADSTITISSPSLISIRQMPYLFSEPPSARSASAF